MVFTADVDEFGEKKEIELKPGGANIAVTDENKREYAECAAPGNVAKCVVAHSALFFFLDRLVAQFRLTRGTEAQTLAFVDGDLVLFVLRFRP